MQRILCIDGDEDFRRTLSGQLAGEGFTVTAAASGAEGLAASAAASFDLIFLDMDLPEPDGLPTYLALRAHPRTRQVPMILCCAVAPKDHWDRLPYDTEGQSFVTDRSEDVGLLLARISQLLAEEIRVTS